MGITRFLWEQKGGSVVTENPKGGIVENVGRIQREATQICSENEDNGWIAKVTKSRGNRLLSKVIRGII